MRHYKENRGKLTFEQVKRIVDTIDMIESCRRAMFDYYVHGKSVKQLGVDSSRTIPLLHKVFYKFIAGDIDNYRHRFLYTNEFNPNAR